MQALNVVIKQLLKKPESLTLFHNQISLHIMIKYISKEIIQQKSGISSTIQPAYVICF